MLELIFWGFSILCAQFFLSSFQVMVILSIFLVKMISVIFSNSEMSSFFFNIDEMSIMLICLSIWISFLMFMASMKNNVFKSKVFVFYTVLMNFLLTICFAVSSVLAFYFFFESVLFPMIMMIFGWGSQPERLQAGFYMLMYTLFGSLPMLLMILFYKENSFSYLYMDWENVKMGMFFMFMMLGFMVKVPVFFLHLWLPKAHVEAPIAGSMILAGILLKLGIYGIFRFKNFFFKDMLVVNHFLMIASIWGSVLISIYCIFQNDIKSLIAYSSVCHMGVVFSGTLTMTFFGSWGSLVLMIGHGLCSSGLFCLANLLYERFYSRSMILIKGMSKIFPSLSLWWFLFSVFNMSAPLTMNLFGEVLLMVSIMKISLLFMIPLMLIIFLSACYSIFMYSYLNHGSGWVLWSEKSILLNEFLLLFLHLAPLTLWILKIDLFLKWI
uniref:NADH-ubiquinone oxidoreductase chain 4 n=1 Tax=Bothriocroton concolor TaxID=65640 RepID=H9M731_BOTCN|nr:NADH dehydrogenase subunit 4 [Bothriocroton concolor]AET63048.1 NADH dehydrogenase subunit 4 [Bothriocroton concolor]